MPFLHSVQVHLQIYHIRPPDHRCNDESGGTTSGSIKDLICLIKCPCASAYEGKTRRALKSRTAEHWSVLETRSSAARRRRRRISVASLRYVCIEHVTALRRGGDAGTLLPLEVLINNVILHVFFKSLFGCNGNFSY